MLQMFDDVLDIDMMCSCHSRIAGREIPTAEWEDLLEKSRQPRVQRVMP
jgi:hypothetical protein